ncbi:MAG TPA: DUF503 domain-containing protein [Anaerolineaceae bacterium]|nr:DUF503 domain-containing protein [Anaerolineaceae bacterium]
MPIGLLTIHLQLPGVKSLKEKRSLIRPVLARLHKEFNVSAAEMDRLDAWQESIIACSLVSNDSGYTQKALQKVLEFTERNWPELPVLAYRIEII